MRRLFVYVALLAAAAPSLFAQVTTTLLIRKPTPVQLTEWRRDPSIARLNVVNTSRETITDAIVSITITNLETGKVVAKTKDYSPSMPRFAFPAGQARLLTGPEMIRKDAFEVEKGLQTTALTTDALPEGQYEICARVLGSDGRTELSMSPACAMFVILITDPPQLIKPVDDYSLPQGYPLFTWTPVVPTSPGQRIQYRIRIVPMFAGQDRRFAMDNNAPLLDKRVATSLYQYMPVDKPFQSISGVVKWAWQIQALDVSSNPRGVPATRNDGKTEIAEFNFTKGRQVSLVNIDPYIPVEGASLKTAVPAFAVKISKLINRNAVKGGVLRVWEKSAPNESNDDAKERTPKFVYSFTGHDESRFTLLEQSGTPKWHRMEFPEINAGKGWDFTAQKNKAYVWDFTLTYDGTLIPGMAAGLPGGSTTSKNGTFTYALTNVSNAGAGQCSSPCVVAAPSNQTLRANNVEVGDVLHAGLFNVEVTSLTNPSPSSLSGQGLVQIPYLKAKVEVEFAGIHVNTSNEVLNEGIKAIYEAPMTIPQANNMAAKLGVDPNTTQDLQEWIGQAGRLVSAFTGLSTTKLPIGIDKEIPGINYTPTIQIIGMVFNPDGAHFNAIMVLPLDFLGPNGKFSFGVNNVCIHQNGIGAGQTPVHMYFMEDFGINQYTDKFSFAFKAADGNDEGTYVDIDCDGLKALRINAEIAFSREMLVPSPDNDPTAKVKMNLIAEMQKTEIRNWMFQFASQTAFSPAAAKDLIITVPNMYLDFAADKNPLGMAFPDAYVGPNKNANAWQGFYLPLAQVQLPEALQTQANPITMQITNMIIDNTGFTAGLHADDIVQYPQADFGTWGASIDHFDLDIVNSSFQQGTMDGRLMIPVSDSYLQYSALLQQSQTKKLGFSFTIQPAADINVPVWKAKFTIFQNSQFTLTINDSTGVRASLLLNGQFGIKGAVGPVPLADFLGIGFQNLQLQTFEPYFQLGNLSFASPEHGLAGFPVGITDFEVKPMPKMAEKRLWIGLKLGLGFQFQPGNAAVSGGTHFTIWGSINMGGQDKMPHFEDAQLDDINLDIDCGATAHIKGLVKFYHEDPTYGNGFLGAVDATILQSFNLQATVQFGSKPKSETESFRYWYVDARAVLPGGIPLGTFLMLRGLGAGAWYHMNPSFVNQQIGQQEGNTADASQPGKSNSNIVFTPDENADFGFKLGAVFSSPLPADQVYNGQLELGVTFVQGGLGSIFIDGDIYMMTKMLDWNNATVHGGLTIFYNHVQKTVDGNIDFAINGGALIEAHGTMVFHAGPDNWFMYIGRPPFNERINVTIMDLVTASAYFECGSVVDDVAPIPDEILSHMSGSLASKFSTSLRQSQADMGSMGGVTLGALTSFPKGGGRKKFTFGPFYAALGAGFGWDASLINYGDMSCAGQNGPVGMDGWYLQGQAYAYLSGSVGISVDLAIISGDFEILGVDAGAALKAQLPNPTWVGGVIYGQYSILGGLISGSVSFEFEVGKQCKLPAANPLDNVKLVSDFRPKNNEPADVFVLPQAAFTFPIYEEFDLPANDPDGNMYFRTFKIELDDFTVENVQGKNVEGFWAVQDGGVTAVFVSKEPFTAKTGFKAAIDASAFEKINGTWKHSVYSAQAKHGKPGQPIHERDSTYFTTGVMIDEIPEQIVEYTYPLDRQRYFLQDQVQPKTGIIKLDRDFQQLFNVTKQGYTTSYIARFQPVNAPEGSNFLETPVTYEPYQVSFPIPALLNNTVYTLTILRRTKSENAQQPDIRSLTGNGGDVGQLGQLQVKQTTVASKQDTYKGGNTSQGQQAQSVTFSNKKGDNTFDERSFSQGQTLDKSTAVITQSTLLASVIAGGDKRLFDISFKTSKYNTLLQKLNAMTFKGTTAKTDGHKVTLRPSYTGDEGFDPYDVSGSKYTTMEMQWVVPSDPDDMLQYIMVEVDKNVGPLVYLKSEEQNRPWHTSFAVPVIYQTLGKIKDAYTKTSSWLFKSAFATCQTTMFNFLKSANRLLEFHKPGTRISPLLTDAEVTPPKKSSGSGAKGSPKGGYSASMQQNMPMTAVEEVISRQGGQLPIQYIMLPVMTLNYNHGYAGGHDYDKMQKAIDKYLAMSYVVNNQNDPETQKSGPKIEHYTIGQNGDPYNDEANQLIPTLENIETKKYKPMFTGQYPMHVSFKLADDIKPVKNSTFTY